MVLCVAQFVVVLDVTIVATALPQIGADLGFRPAQVGWVIAAYTAVMAGLLLLGGRIADRYGSRRVFAVGLALFTAASLACALAWSPAVLVAARIVQGLAAALLSPAALAALHELVQDPASRRRALGWWTAAAAGGGASGWMLGGMLVEFAGWRWVFAINVPIGLTALVASRRALAQLAGRPHRGQPRLDLIGAAAATGSIGLTTLALSQLAARPGSPIGWVLLVAAAALMVGFIARQRRTRYPLLPGSVLRTPGVVGGNLTATALTASTTPAMLAVVFYVHDVLRLAPATGSLLFPLFNVAVVAGSLIAPRLMGRRDPRVALVVGFGGIIIGTCLLLGLPDRGLPVLLLLTAFAAMGAGLGGASVASTTVGTARVAGADRGVAAGLLNSTAQLGSALGLALTAPLLAPASSMTGYRLAFTIAAVIAATGILGALTVPGRTHRSEDGRRQAAILTRGRQR